MMRIVPVPKRTGFIILMIMLICGAAISIAIAQPKSAFNLNSPASFPVDI